MFNNRALKGLRSIRKTWLIFQTPNLSICLVKAVSTLAFEVLQLWSSEVNGAAIPETKPMDRCGAVS